MRSAPSRGSREPKEPDDVAFEHNGDMYIPKGEKFSQIALHMKYTYGVDYTWVINDGDAKTALLHHGVKANRKVIETIAQYSLEQGLTPRLIKVEELYAPNMMES